jgi:hypothetical protein
MTDRGDFMDPDYDPGEFDLVERRLRRALHQEAQQMEPTDRLDDILAASGSGGGGADHRDPGGAGGGGGPGRQGPPRWLAPVAAAAAVAVIAGTVWVATRGEDQAAPPAGPSATQSSAPGPSPSSAEPTPTPSSSAPTSTAPSTQEALLPVYFVGPVGGEREVFRLYREFLRGTVPVSAGDAEKAQGALDLAMNAQPFSNTDGYLQPWSGTSVEAVQVTPKRITITLSNPGSPGINDKEIARVAVQSLVWTAQAAVGKGTIPVTFAIADGSTELFGQFPASDTYNRPASRDEYYRDLAPIWITAPGRDAVLPAGKPVVVKGEATVFEANVQWELERGTTAVKKGFATASIGAPGRGEYSFSVGTLAPGSYTIRVFEMSMESGDKVNAEKWVNFSVK